MDQGIVRWLATHDIRELVDRLSQEGGVGVKQAVALNQEYGEDRARAIVGAVEIRPKAVAKWGPGSWLVTDRGIQQATDRAIARYKAQRIPFGTEILDLCCGVGGESMELSRRGPLLAVDRDEAILAMAEYNVGVDSENHLTDSRFQCGDALVQKVSEDAWVNVDPDRRSDRGRTVQTDMIQPTLQQLMPIVSRASAATIKLAPATRVTDEYARLGEREWISFRGQCRQQVLRLGEHAVTGSTTATRVDSDGLAISFSGCRQEVCPLSDVPGKFVYDLDPAVRAAGLSAAFARSHELKAIGGPSGYFTSDSPCAPGLLQTFEVLWHGQVKLKRISAALRSLGIRVTEVKCRGLDWDPARTLKQLKSSGEQAATLLVSRAGSRSQAVLAIRRDIPTSN